MSVPQPSEAPCDCDACPRLVDYRHALRAEHDDWFNNPVESFGDTNARLLIVGHATGARGANRTGRPITDDIAGELHYATLGKFGFATGTYAGHAADGVRLTDCMITNAVRCVPPENKPVGAEINACRPFLIQRIDDLPRLEAIVTLGKIAHDSTIRALGGRLREHPFGHGASSDLNGIAITASYHCSRYNTNTGRLTEAMFHDVFSAVRAQLD